MIRPTAQTQIAFGHVPSRAEVDASIARGARLHAEAVSNGLASATRALAGLIFSRTPDGKPATRPHIHSLPSSLPNRGMIGLFIARESWVRNEGYPALKVIEAKPQPGPDASGQDSEAA